MNIAFVLDTMKYGGIERISINYLNMLVNMGHQVDVMILNSKVEDIVEEIPKECSIDYINFPRYLCPHAYWGLGKKLRGGMILFPFIFVILTILTPIFKLLFANKKHYDLAIAFSGHYNDLTYVNQYLNVDKRICWLHGALNNYLSISPGFGYLYKKIGNIVVLSHSIEDERLLRTKLKDIRSIKIYNPISISEKPIDNMMVSSLKEKYGEFALMVGRFSPQKDQKTVIRAFKILKTEYKSSLKIVFVGDGEDMLKVKQYAEKLDVLDIVIFEGTKQDVQNYYKASRIFVHSSPAEGLPTVLLEAMSFGIPIVATNSKPGVQEIIMDEKYGLICPVGNAEIMAQKINRMLNDKELYKKYKREGYERIKEFSTETIENKFRGYINSIMGGYK